MSPLQFTDRTFIVAGLRLELRLWLHDGQVARQSFGQTVQRLLQQSEFIFERAQAILHHVLASVHLGDNFVDCVLSLRTAAGPKTKIKRRRDQKTDIIIHHLSFILCICVDTANIKYWMGFPLPSLSAAHDELILPTAVGEGGNAIDREPDRVRRTD